LLFKKIDICRRKVVKIAKVSGHNVDTKTCLITTGSSEAVSAITAVAASPTKAKMAGTGNIFGRQRGADCQLKLLRKQMFAASIDRTAANVL
jgi:hypothetical protein